MMLIYDCKPVGARTARLADEYGFCKEHSFLEVYESIMFTYLRGISTEKGARKLEEFIREYRKSRQPNTE